MYVFSVSVDLTSISYYWFTFCGSSFRKYRVGIYWEFGKKPMTLYLYDFLLVNLLFLLLRKIRIVFVFFFGIPWFFGRVLGCAWSIHVCSANINNMCYTIGSNDGFFFSCDNRPTDGKWMKGNLGPLCVNWKKRTFS